MKLPEPAATQYDLLTQRLMRRNISSGQLLAALDQIHADAKARDAALIARANAEYAARKAARPDYTEASEAELDDYLDSLPSVADVDHELARLMPVTQRFFPTGGDDVLQLLTSNESVSEGPRVQAAQLSKDRTPQVPQVRGDCGEDEQGFCSRCSRRAFLVALYVAAVVAVAVLGNAFMKWAAANGHRALFDWLGGGQ